MDAIRREHPNETTAFKAAVAWSPIIPPPLVVGGERSVGVGNAKQFSTLPVEALFYHVLFFHHITPI